MKINRLLSIILLLLEKNKLTASQLAEQLEVTVRTIYRDVETLSQAGIPIVTYAGPQGGIAIMDKFKLNHTFFTSSDLVILLKGLTTVSSLDDINHTLIKIQSLIPKGQQNELEAQANNTLIDLQPWFSQDDVDDQLILIKQALTERYVIRFAYRNRDGYFGERYVEPYQLIFKQGSWYLKGYCLMKHDWRLFKVSRLTELVLSEQHYLIRQIPITENDQCWNGAKITSIKLLIDEGLIEQIKEYVGKHRVRKLDTGKYLVDYPFLEDECGYQQLLSYGDKCQCLEPPHVRQELIFRLKRTLQHYQ